MYYDSCIIHWKPPADDGGTALTHYIVECLDVTDGNTEWVQCAETMTADELSAKCVNLKTRHKYKFRVCAFNRLGKSEPGLLPGDGVLIKDPWGMSYCKDRQMLKLIHEFSLALR